MLRLTPSPSTTSLTLTAIAALSATSAITSSATLPAAHAASPPAIRAALPVAQPLPRPDPTKTLTIFTNGWPRAYFFRAAEGLAANPRITFDVWEKTFSRLMGIEGKALDEELPGRSRRNISFFSRFKTLHPRQLVLLHFNGNACDPYFAQSLGLFAGHFVYHTGARITRDVPAEAGITEIHVSDTRPFRTGIGRFGDRGDDIGLCLLDENGHPNWHYCEQVKLIRIDHSRHVLIVQRGCYGTAPRFFPAGKSYAAAHVTEGPWGRNARLLWFYNYSTKCPRDQSGRTCADILAEKIASWFSPSGPLSKFDGLEFDVLSFQRFPANYSGPRGIDTDADGRHDAGFSDGINCYGIGVYRFAQKLRRLLGPRILILADGHMPNSQRCFGLFNGIESEGWPNLKDWDFNDWSGGLNRHLFWNAHAHKPAFSYVNHKYIQGAEGRYPKLPFPRHRLAMAAAVLMHAAICYSFPPPRPRSELYGIWDELVGGTLHRPGWLGKPLAPPIRLGLRAPDLLKSAGRSFPRSFLSRWSGYKTSISRDGQSLRLQAQPGANRIFATLHSVPSPSEDLLLKLTVRAAPRRGYPAQIPRLVWVAIEKPPTELIRRFPPPEAGICLRGQPEKPFDPSTGATVRYMPALQAGGERREAYFTHPPYLAGPGYVFWQRQVTLPSRPILKFAIAMGRLSPQRSDGVLFIVQVIPKSGQPIEVFRKLYNEYRWQDFQVSLRRWAGQAVTLRFIADSGPRNNTTTDHAAWADVRVVQAGKPEVRIKPQRIMTFATSTPFTSTFYFRPLPAKSVDISIEAEGTEPLWIDEITAHAAPDLQAREFENGAVLANPSLQEATFNLAQLFPGHSFRRLKATPLQDTQTNNGQPAGPTVTLGPLDALFLLKQ